MCPWLTFWVGIFIQHILQAFILTRPDHVCSGPSFNFDTVSLSVLLYLRRDFLLLIGYSQSMPVSVMGMSASTVMFGVWYLSQFAISTSYDRPIFFIGACSYFIGRGLKPGPEHCCRCEVHLNDCCLGISSHMRTPNLENFLNAFEENWGPLSETRGFGIPYQAKWLLRWPIAVSEVELLSLST